MSFLELAKERYSVRKFQDREITQSDMDKILEAANVAPTGCNYQPQRIYVVKSKENLAKLNELCKCIFGAKTVTCLHTELTKSGTILSKKAHIPVFRT